MNSLLKVTQLQRVKHYSYFRALAMVTIIVFSAAASSYGAVMMVSEGELIARLYL